MDLSTEIYVLGLSVLKHEPDTHKILADILEEQGERGMAQWARSKKSSRIKRLDFVLAVLPIRVGVRVACDFAERALEMKPQPLQRSRRSRGYIPDEHPPTKDMLQLVGKAKLLVAESVNTESVFDPLSEWYQTSFYGAREEVEMLLEIKVATECLWRAQEYQAANDYKGERTQVTACRTAVRKVAKLTRELISRKYFRRSFEMRDKTVDYPNWQFEHLQNLLTELIDKADG